MWLAILLIKKLWCSQSVDITWEEKDECVVLKEEELTDVYSPWKEEEYIAEFAPVWIIHFYWTTTTGEKGNSVFCVANSQILPEFIQPAKTEYNTIDFLTRDRQEIEEDFDAPFI